MKTNNVYTLMTIIIILALCFATTQFVKADSKTIVVPDDYQTISAAIENASDGDTIFVKSGTYNEQPLLIDKSITLIGEEAYSTQVIFHSRQFNKTFDFHGSNVTYPLWEQILNITAPNVKLSGLTIKCSDNGAISLTGDGTQIIGNNIEWSISGSGNRIQIMNNSFAGGIRLTGSNLTIAQNTLGGTIDCHQGSYNIIAENVVGTGIRGSDEPYYPCINVGSFGIVIGNNITVGTVGGLKLDGNGSIAAKNTITSSIWANGSNNIVYANTVTHGGLIVTGDDNTFFANNVGGYNETITNKQYGYDPYRFASYSFQSAPYALSLGTCYFDVLRGIRAEDAVNNTFYHNNFVGNTQLRLWDGVYGPNFWDNGQQGNYWIDYNGTDDNHDGIGDAPYFLDIRDRDFLPIGNTGIQDSYPLMAPFNIDGGSVELPEWACEKLRLLPDPLQEPTQETQPKPFPTLPVAALASASAVAVGVGILVYFKKHRR